MEAYEELRWTSYPRLCDPSIPSYGHSGSLPVEGGDTTNRVGKPSKYASVNHHNPNISNVYPSDFLADVDILARKTLNEDEMKLFKLLGPVDNNHGKLEKIEASMAEEAFVTLVKRIANKMGWVFLLNGLSPVSKYFKPIDRRIRREQ